MQTESPMDASVKSELNQYLWSIFSAGNISLWASEDKPTHELHLPLPHTLHLYSSEVWQVIILVPQGVSLQAEGGQASRSIPARENAIRTIWGGKIWIIEVFSRVSSTFTG